MTHRTPRSGGGAACFRQGSAPGGQSAGQPDDEPRAWAERELYGGSGLHLQKHALDRYFQSARGEFVKVDYQTGAIDNSKTLNWAKELNGYLILAETVTRQRMGGRHACQPALLRRFDLQSIDDA